MKQSSLFLAKLIVPLFLVTFVTAIILNFTNKSVDVSFFSYEEALKDAKTNDKYALIYFYNKFSSQSQLITNLIFKNNDSLVQKLNENYSIAGISLQNKDFEILEKNYNLDAIPFLVICNSEGREVYRKSGQEIMRIISRVANKNFPSVTAKWKTFEEAKKKAKDQNSNIIVFLASYDNGANNINLMLSNKAVEDYIATNFVPTVLLGSSKEDVQLAKKYHEIEENREYALVISPDNEILAKVRIAPNMFNTSEFIYQVKDKLGEE